MGEIPPEPRCECQIVEVNVAFPEGMPPLTGVISNTRLVIEQCRLCQSAPYLLAALTECLRTRWTGDRSRNNDPVLVMAKAAIAKAEGR